MHDRVVIVAWTSGSVTALGGCCASSFSNASSVIHCITDRALAAVHACALSQRSCKMHHINRKLQSTCIILTGSYKVLAKFNQMCQCSCIKLWKRCHGLTVALVCKYDGSCCIVPAAHKVRTHATGLMSTVRCERNHQPNAGMAHIGECLSITRMIILYTDLSPADI